MSRWQIQTFLFWIAASLADAVAGNMCVCVCVCVCVFIFFHREGFFRLQDVHDMLEMYGSTNLCCEYLSGCYCQFPSSLFPNLSLHIIVYVNSNSWIIFFIKQFFTVIECFNFWYNPKKDFFVFLRWINN